MTLRVRLGEPADPCPRDGDGDGHGHGDDPYDDPGFTAALTDGRARPRRARVEAAHGAVELLTLWAPGASAGQWIVRTVEYGALRLEGSWSPAELAAARAALDAALRADGAVSEVDLIGPWSDVAGPAGSPAAALAAAWGVRPHKDVAVVDWGDEPPALHAVDAKLRNDVRTGLRQRTCWRRFTGADVGSFARRYAALMDGKQADPRWRLARSHFDALAACSTTELWLSTVDAIHPAHADDPAEPAHPAQPAGHAAALFARRGSRATYLYAVREGAVRGGPAGALWQAFEGLHALGVRHVLLGGGVAADPSDGLWRFKRRFATGVAPLLLGARAFDPDGHAAAVAAGLARPLPEGSTLVD